MNAPTSHPLQCRCGTVKGFVADARNTHRALCYCKDCQAFAHFLKMPTEILDERGGSDVIQTLPKNVTFTQGTKALACMRLTDNGLLRWYAACCNTPVGNTLPSFKLSFVGLVHSCLANPNQSLQDSFGAVRAVVNTQGAMGTPKPQSKRALAAIGWALALIARARIDGSYKQTPFFHVEHGTPIATPRVLSGEERAQLRNAVDATAA
jgi:hypothetical protein